MHCNHICYIHSIGFYLVKLGSHAVFASKHAADFVLINLNMLKNLLSIEKPLFCTRCWCQIQSRNFRLTPISGISLNVSKILDDIQNRKLNRTRKSKARPEEKHKRSENIERTSSSQSHNFFSVKNTTSNCGNESNYTTRVSKRFKDVQKSLQEKDEKIQTLSLSPSNLIECNTSNDIFKELDLETFSFENSDNPNFMSSDMMRSEAEYDIFDDAHLTKKNLLSYIHVCIYNDSLSEAHSFMLEFIGKFSNSLSSIDIANCCELLIKGWARKGNPVSVCELKDYIQNSLQQRLNIQVYEFYLLALAKQVKDTTPETVKAILSEMKDNNLNPEFLFFKSSLNSKEIRQIIDMLKDAGIELRLKRYHYPKRYHNKHMENIISETQKRYEPFKGVDLSQMDSLIEEQFAAEMNSVVKVDPIDARFYDLEAKKSESFYRSLIELLEAEWKVTLNEAFQNYLKTIRSNHKRLNGIPFVHYMTILEPEVYVEAMLEEIRKCSSFSEYYSPFASQLFETLGRKIMSQYLLRSNINDGTFADFKHCYKQYVRYTLDPELITKYNPREYWQHLLESGHHYFFDEGKYWPNNVLKKIGQDLYEIISSDAKFNSLILELANSGPAALQPVVSFVYKSHDTYKTKKELRVHPFLIKLYEGAGSQIHFDSERLPMLSPPLPWINANFGGNLLIRNFIVRLPQYYPRQKLKRLPMHQMYPTYDSLNALSLCPWKINDRILDIAIEIFKNGGNPDLDIPVSLSYFGPLPRASSEMSPKEKAFIYHKRKSQKKEQSEMYSLWVDCLYKLSIGNSLRNRVFWFPINTDFRSRVYPVPPNFNHLGSDLSRSLLHFAKGSPLGEQGLNWLKIHLINLTGLKKRCSTEERLAYANEILDLILDSADKPLDGQRWWMQSDEKWQTLACCMELANAIRSGDPHSYVSHIPVHQDGSCNGLQHYAALGRDVLGAKSVNLSPAEYPQDVYSDVAALVEAEIEHDCQNGVEIANTVKGFVSRKIVKQTVMTYVYGVTKYGAKLQVLKRLKEDAKFPETRRVAVSVYISEKIFLSIRKMFTQTRVIQDWLTSCAQIISNDYNATVEWTTPLGFPVVQSYYKSPKHKNLTIPLIPNTMKQKNAFPANFIHSLDSSHMMLTSLQCHRHGLTFASVHDCYWTHASHIDQMNYFCRKQFVALHSQPILDNLALQLKAQLETLNQTQNVPSHRQFLLQVNKRIAKGDFDLNSIMRSVYFFS